MDKNTKKLKKNTKKQSFDELLSLYCRICNSLEEEYSYLDMLSVKESLRDIILKF